MTITVKKIRLWSTIVDNKAGALANVLEPLADAGADLEVVMGTAIPGSGNKASVGVFPVTGRKAQAAAAAVGMAPAAAMPSLLVGGDNRAGLGREMSETLAAAGINIGIALAQVVGSQFSAVFGFASEEDAARAAALLKKVGARKPAARKTVAPPKTTRQPAGRGATAGKGRASR